MCSTLGRAFGVFLALGAQAFVTSTALAEWPIKQFQVFVGEPRTNSFKLGVSVEDVLRVVDDYADIDIKRQPAVPVDESLIREIESYLGAMASELETLGFAAPVLEPVVELADGSKAYRVYLYDFADPNGTASYRSDANCEDSVRPFIHINARRYVPDGKKLTDKGYQDLPHELFHAVQQSYPLIRKNCKLGDWIVEGTAQAIGADLAAWPPFNRNYPNRVGTWMRDRWGRRAYDKSLWVPSGGDGANSSQYVANDAYGASSFWRYLGEHAATGGTAGTGPVKPDYRYLLDFFAGDAPAAQSAAAELTWLNDRLLTHPDFEIGLHRLYPQFITTYASYMYHRIKPASVPPADAVDQWLQILFPTTCPEIRVSDANPVFLGKITVKANAATCFRLNLGFYQPVDLQVELSGVDVPVLRSISLGTEQGAIIAQPILKKQLDGSWTGSRVLHFRDPMSTPQPQLIISNVSLRPADSRDFTATIEIAASGFDHTMLPEAAKARPPGTAKKGTPAAAGAAGSSNTAADQVGRVGRELDQGMESLNPHLANGTEVSWQTRQHPCDDAFVTSVCGPHTLISLSAVPGMFASLEQTTGRGGEFGQFFSMLGGMAEGGPLELSEKYREALMKAQESDGADVVIAIPLIDYGFTGTFNNASIQVSKRGGGSYQAIGPRDIQPGPGAEYALSGKVTIEEFSPSILRGSFQGGMVDPDSEAMLRQEETLPVKATVSGKFLVVNTWERDARIHREAAEDIAASVLADVAALSSQPTTVFPDIDAAPEVGAGAGSSGSISGSGLATQCDCSCNAASDPEAACETYCAGTFRACRGEVATAMTLRQNAFQPTELAADVGEPFLRTIPDACDLLDAKALAQQLKAPKVIQKGPHEWYPKALSQCGYVVQDQRGVGAGLNMMFQPLHMYNSREHSVETLKLRVIGFGTVDASTVHDAPGNIAIVTHAGDNSNLVVLTGIYGFGWESEDFTTELVLTYSLQHAALSPEERSKLLMELAQPQVARLKKLSVTTHEGG